MKPGMVLLLAALTMPCQGMAWIAYGFKSGMSRFDVALFLAERGSLVVTEGAQETVATGNDGATEYNLVYCATPQKLYLMKFALPDSPDVFARTLKKFERRYGMPEGLEQATASLQSGNWQAADVSLIWNLNESETILLRRDGSGMRAEFQDVSVCR